jgi:hypothetical protein
MPKTPEQPGSGDAWREQLKVEAERAQALYREAREAFDQLEAHHRPESYAVLGDRLRALNNALTDVLAIIRQR